MKPTHPVWPTRPSDARQDHGARRGGKGEGSQRIPPSPWGRRTQGRGERNKEKDFSYPLSDMTSAQSSGRPSLCACRPRDEGWQGGRCSSEACGQQTTLGAPRASASSKQSNPHSIPHRHGEHSPPKRAGSPTTCATSAHQLTGHVAESHRVLSRKTSLKNRCTVPMGALQRRCPKCKT